MERRIFDASPPCWKRASGNPLSKAILFFSPSEWVYLYDVHYGFVFTPGAAAERGLGNSQIRTRVADGARLASGDRFGTLLLAGVDAFLSRVSCAD